MKEDGEISSESAEKQMVGEGINKHAGNVEKTRQTMKGRYSENERHHKAESNQHVCMQALLWICGACHLHVLAERQSRAIVGVLNPDEEAWQLKLCQTIFKSLKEL